MLYTQEISAVRAISHQVGLYNMCEGKREKHNIYIYKGYRKGKKEREAINKKIKKEEELWEKDQYVVNPNHKKMEK